LGEQLLLLNLLLLHLELLLLLGELLLLQGQLLLALEVGLAAELLRRRRGYSHGALKFRQKKLLNDSVLFVFLRRILKQRKSQEST
jgi:hypothetical protein